MTDWTAGYVADIGYTYGYYTELNPLRVRLAFLNAGLVPPEGKIGDRPRFWKIARRK